MCTEEDSSKYRSKIWSCIWMIKLMNFDNVNSISANRKDFYPDAEEEITNNLPKPKGSKVQMTVYMDADHAHDLIIRII
jgi:hypothetical protein